MPSPQFEEIDAVINQFLQTTGRGHRIRIHNRPRTDWQIFEWRQLTWKRDGMELGLEIYPVSTDKDEISSWTFYAFCTYDLNGWRHYLNKPFLENVPLEVIVNKLAELLPIAFSAIQSISFDEVPPLVKLRQ